MASPFGYRAPANLDREPRVEIRYFVGCDPVAVLGSLPHRIRDGLGLGRRELGVGERTGDNRGACSTPTPSPKMPTSKGRATATGRDPRRVARGAGIGCAGAADGRWRGTAGQRVRARRGVSRPIDRVPSDSAPVGDPRLGSSVLTTAWTSLNQGFQEGLGVYWLWISSTRTS